MIRNERVVRFWVREMEFSSYYDKNPDIVSTFPCTENSISPKRKFLKSFKNYSKNQKIITFKRRVFQACKSYIHKWVKGKLWSLPLQALQ